jgi:hypothetical protein
MHMLTLLCLLEINSDTMSSDSERAALETNTAASPPYEVMQQSSSIKPPGYQTESSDRSEEWPSHSSDIKGKQKTPPEGDHLRDSERAKSTPQGPRIAVVDPLLNTYDPEERKEEENTLHLKIHPPFDDKPSLSRRNSDASTIDDGGDEFDEFDWSEDEEERRMAAEEEKQAHAVVLKRRKWSPFSIVKWLATTFLGNLIICIILVVPVVVVQFVYRGRTAQDANTAHREYIADNAQAWLIWVIVNLHLAWWIHLIVELLPGIGVSFVKAVWGGVSQKERGLVEGFNVIKLYIKIVCYAGLAWASWAILFNSIYGLYNRTNPETQSRAKYLYRIYQVVEFFFFFTLTVCAEKILLKIISMRFHLTAFADRIAKVTKQLTVFDYLKDHRPKTVESGHHTPFGLRVGGRTPAGGRTPIPASAKTSPLHESGNVSEKESTQDRGYFGRKTHAHKRPVNQAVHSPAAAQDGMKTPGDRSIKSSRSTDAARAMRERASHATALARVAMVDPTHLLTDKTVGVGLDVNSPAQARRLARRIFRSFRGQHRRKYLIPSDFDVAYTDSAQAKEAFDVFDSDRNGDVSAVELRNTIVGAYKERRFIAKSLEDTSHALSSLDFILLAIAGVILIFEAFAIFKVSIGNSLTTVYTLAIGASFIFKESAQNVFDSIIFIFVTHPFDTGDRISVNGDVMVVQKMNLLSCQFLLWDNTQIYMSNPMLSQLFITNYRRSGYQWECVTVQVAFDTPWDNLDAVQADLIHWLQTEPERMFEPSTAIVPQTIDYMRSMTVTIGMTHRASYQDWGARYYRRNAFFSAVCYYMRKHGVRYTNSNQPIFYADPPSYNVSEELGGTDRGSNGSSDRRSDQPEDTMPPLQDPFTVINDDFSADRPAGTLAGTGSTAIKPKTFMNFAPPSDEISGSEIRIRKARQGRKGMAQQGGDS